MTLRFSSILVLSLAALACRASAQVSFAGSYSENFNELGTAGTTAPTGWSVYSLSGSHDLFSYAGAMSGTTTIATTFLPNSTSTAINVGTGTSSTTPEPTLVATTGTTGKGVTGYNFALSTSTGDRALGSSPSGNAATELQLALINQTGGSLSSLDISYDIRRFSTTKDANGYTGPYAGVEELPGYWLLYSLDNGADWTNVGTLNPTLTGTNGTIAVPNSTGVTNVPTTAFSLTSPWTAGSTLELRWVDDNAESPSPDQLLGLDNVAVTAPPAAVPEPGSFALLGAGSVLALAARRRSMRKVHQ